MLGLAAASRWASAGPAGIGSAPAGTLGFKSACRGTFKPLGVPLGALPSLESARGGPQRVPVWVSLRLAFVVFGLRRVWVSSCLDFIVFGFRRVRVSSCSGCVVFGLRRVWVASCLGFVALGSRRVGASLRWGPVGLGRPCARASLRSVFAQVCQGEKQKHTQVWERRVVRARDTDDKAATFYANKLARNREWARKKREARVKAAGWRKRLFKRFKKRRAAAARSRPLFRIKADPFWRHDLVVEHLARNVQQLGGSRTEQLVEMESRFRFGVYRPDILTRLDDKTALVLELKMVYKIFCGENYMESRAIGALKKYEKHDWFLDGRRVIFLGVALMAGPSIRNEGAVAIAGRGDDSVKDSVIRSVMQGVSEAALAARAQFQNDDLIPKSETNEYCYLNTDGEEKKFAAGRPPPWENKR